MMSSYPDSSQQDISGSFPPPTHHIRHHGHKRRATLEYPNGELLSLGDQNIWYYPMHGHDSDEEELPVALPQGNWGNKNVKGGRWVRRGKITPWGPGMDDWEADERARKRIKLLLPQERRSPSPPALPHLARSPSPPLVSPYPPPTSQHLSYTSFVMDKSVTHTFRSNLLDELEEVTNGLVEGEATLRRALGRLWQVMSEDPDKNSSPTVVPKLEDENDDTDTQDDQARRVARAPDSTPSTHKIFLTPAAVPTAETRVPITDNQLSTLERSQAILRELQDDGREYVERLTEIREGLGDVRSQRNVIWNMVRERAVDELQDTAISTVHG